MSTIALAGNAPAAIDLNQPGTYLNWNIFTISVANLVLIAVMVAIFGAALLLPFPGATAVTAARCRSRRKRRNRTGLPPIKRPRGMSGCGRRECAAGR